MKVRPLIAMQALNQAHSLKKSISTSTSLLPQAINRIVDKFPKVEVTKDSSELPAWKTQRLQQLIKTCSHRSNNGSRTDLLQLPLTHVLSFGHQKRFHGTVATVGGSPFNVPDFTDVMKDPKASGEAASNKPFTYFVVGATGVFTGMAAKSTAMNFLSTLSASGDVLALAQVEVDLAGIPEGKSVVLKWRGKPVFIRHRTPEEIEEAQSVDVSQLRDPQTDADRTKKPEWIVMMGVCTHLGCVPVADSGDFGGWYCPCHGSHYDISGRIRKGPAPLNLEIPKYKFADDGSLVIG